MKPPRSVPCFVIGLLGCATVPMKTGVQIAADGRHVCCRWRASRLARPGRGRMCARARGGAPARASVRAPALRRPRSGARAQARVRVRVRARGHAPAIRGVQGGFELRLFQPRARSGRIARRRCDFDASVFCARTYATGSRVRVPFTVRWMPSGFAFRRASGSELSGKPCRQSGRAQREMAAVPTLVKRASVVAGKK